MRSGLAGVLKCVRGIGVVRLNNREVVQHPAVGPIVGAYDQRTQQTLLQTPPDRFNDPRGEDLRLENRRTSGHCQ
jgi:hypothetical protein